MTQSLLAKVSAGAMVLTASQILAQASVFVRNVVVVRTLTQAEFGVAATFIVVLSLLETLSNLSIETLLLQAKNGEETRFQATAHMVRGLEGLLMAIFLVVSAPWLASLFHTESATWCYQALAIAAVAKGLTHFDAMRFMRNGRFGAHALSTSFGEFASLVFVLVACHWIQDFSLVMWALIIRFCAASAISHWCAERRYVWAFDRATCRRILDFGWPLLLSAMLVWFILQGDRFLIGSAKTVSIWWADLFGGTVPSTVFTKIDLAAYSVAVGLTMMPGAFIDQVLGSLVFPLLARQQDDRAKFERVFLAGGLANAVVASAVAVFFLLAGGSAVALIYGEEYRITEEFIGWLGVLLALRVVRGSVQGASLALGDSKMQLAPLAVRFVGLPIAIWAVVSGGALSHLALAGVVGEGLALATAVLLVHRRHQVSLASIMPPVAYTLGMLGLAVLAREELLPADDRIHVVAGIVGLILTPILALACMPASRRELRAAMLRRRAAKGTA